jgi:hypothetical protein
VDNIKYLDVVDISHTDASRNIIEFYDKDKNKIFESEYELIGSFTPHNKIWSWAWSIPIIKSSHTYIIGKIFNYARQLPTTELFLRTELLTSKFKISTSIQLDIHTSIASYLSKQPFILNYILDANDNTEKDGIIDYKELKNMEDINNLPQNSVVHFLFILNPPVLEDFN